MLYQATHTTRYEYESAVPQSQSEARLTPRTTPRQRLLRARLDSRPEPAVLNTRTDYFGNTVTAFSVFRPHQRFEITATSVVEVLARAEGPLPETGWQEAREALAGPGAGHLEALEFLFDSPYVAASEELRRYAAASFPAGRGLAEGVVELSSRVHGDFEYRPLSTSIEMPLEEVFRLRRGVCQDFAHVLIGALRSLRLPARYVSGYLRSAAGFQGAEASHAWVSVFVPGYGWLDVDPTNDCLPSDGHVTLAWGRDFGDVTPLKGISLGGGTQRVEVEVRVEALEPDGPAGGD